MDTMYELWARSVNWDDEFLDAHLLIGGELCGVLDGLCWC